MTVAGDGSAEKVLIGQRYLGPDRRAGLSPGDLGQHAPAMLEAGFWGLVGGAALLIGAVDGLYLPASQKAIGLVMGFGAGVLISAVAFELTAEAYRRSGEEAVVIGLALGALTFFLGDRML